MFVLDTNVLSELVKASPQASVQDWLLNHVAQGLNTTTVSQAEMMAGIALLPDGRRKQDLHAAALRMFSLAFGGRILPFDREAVDHFAAIVAARQGQGRRIPFADALIAAIARRHGATVVTRNASDFQGCGLEVRDPWTEP